MKAPLQYVLKSVGLRALSAFFAVFMVFLPLIANEPYVLHMVILSMIYSVLALSWNFICGYAGIFTFGHQGFFGLGAYVSALMSMKLGVSPWLALPIAGFVAAIISIFIGLPSLRVRGAPYIALVTLGFSEILRITCMNLVDLTRGELGLWGIPTFSDIHLGSLSVSFSGVSRIPHYYLMLTIFFVAILVFYKNVHSATGLALTSIRESAEAAESLGVNIIQYKLYAFVVSSFFAGIMGSFYAHYVLILTPTSSFNIHMMVEIVAITLIGGLGTISGPIAGAFLLTIGLESLRAFGEYRIMIYGVLLVIAILFIPNGVVRKLFPRLEKGILSLKP